MKFFLPLFLILSASAFAAETTTPSETSAKANRAWLMVGPGFSGYSGSATQNSNVSSRTAFTVEAEVERPFIIPGLLSIQYGVDYFQKGASLNNFSVHANYFELPMLLRGHMDFAFGEISAMVGPYLAVAAARSTDTNGNSGDATNLIRWWDWGLRYGLAYSKSICEHMDVTAGVDYEMGLLNVDKAVDNTSTSLRNKSWVVALGAGYRF